MTDDCQQKANKSMMPFIQVANEARGAAETIAAGLGITKAQAMGALVQFWFIIRDTQVDNQKEHVELPVDLALELFVRCLELKRMSPDVRQTVSYLLISSNVVCELGATHFRIKGMSRYLEAKRKHLKKQEYDASRYKSSSKIPRKFHNGFTSSEAEAETNRERKGTKLVHEPDGSSLAINLSVEDINKLEEPKQNQMFEAQQTVTRRMPQLTLEEATKPKAETNSQANPKHHPKEPSDDASIRKVTELWNAYKPHECPKVTTITGARLRLVQKFLKRWKDPWLVGSLAYSLRANQGFHKSKTGWIANIEYILRESNQASLVELAPQRIQQVPDGLREQAHLDLLACAKECIELDGGV